MESELDTAKAFTLYPEGGKLSVSISSPGIKYLQSQLADAFTLTPVFCILLAISSVAIFNAPFAEDKDVSAFTSFIIHLLVSGSIAILSLLLLANHLFLRFGSTTLIINANDFEISRQLLGMGLKERGRTKAIRAVGLVYEPASDKEDEKRLVRKCCIFERHNYRFGMYLSDDNQEQIAQAIVSFLEENRQDKSYYSEYVVSEGYQEKMWRFPTD